VSVSIDGTWNMLMTTPMGERPIKFRFASENGDLSGAVIGDQGERALESASRDGDNVTFGVTVPTQFGDMKLDFAGAVSGDDIAGTVKLGMFGEAPFKGSRETS
jgi:hypothetical protein